jgi:hypothetical protein
MMMIECSAISFIISSALLLRNTKRHSLSSHTHVLSQLPHEYNDDYWQQQEQSAHERQSLCALGREISQHFRLDIVPVIATEIVISTSAN